VYSWVMQQAMCCWRAVIEHCLSPWHREVGGEVVLLRDYWLKIATVHLLPFFLKLRLALVKQTSNLQQQIVLDVCWRRWHSHRRLPSNVKFLSPKGIAMALLVHVAD